jgi:hypothetical protein
LPRAGDYDIKDGSIAINTNASLMYHSYDIGVTGAVDADGLVAQVTAAGQNADNYRSKRKAGLTAVALVSKYKTNAGTATFGNRQKSVLPIRLRHDA